MGRNRRITDSKPQNTVTWDADNKSLGRRNLCTVAGDHVGFSIWNLPSVGSLAWIWRQAARTRTGLGVT
ncbi:MAG: hypothetical protein JO236_13515 [Mycobacterium sp.]|uniref:hypothetical protein n=1 Tax=Mycobacterium sp. TaxID=1785 RepID=UPI001EC26B2F|nr:hypothetical protein [Mycobacterium sp.]MBW0018546.1 hypothetical protein [Mycobacterium sp.]